MRVGKGKHNIIILFMVGMISSLTILLNAQSSRVEPEVLKAACEQNPIEKLLISPLSNMDNIKGLYLQPRNQKLEYSIDKILDALKQKHPVDERTALHLLLGEAYKILCIQKVMSQNPPNIITGSYMSKVDAKKNLDIIQKYRTSLTRLVSALIADFNELPETKEYTKLSTQLHGMINYILENKLLMPLSLEMRELVIEKYLKSTKFHFEKFSPSQIAAIYQNLEFEPNLESIFRRPSKEIENIEELRWKMEFAESMGLPQKAIEFADMLLPRLESMKGYHVNSMLDAVSELYVRCQPEAVEEKLLAISSKRPMLLVKIYKSSCALSEKTNRNDLHRKWLMPCMLKIKENIEKKHNSNPNKEIFRHYFAIAYELYNAEDFKAVFYILENSMLLCKMSQEDMPYNMQLLLGRCYVKAGNNKKAADTYRLCLKNDELSKEMKKNIENELNQIFSKSRKGERR